MKNPIEVSLDKIYYAINKSKYEKEHRTTCAHCGLKLEESEHYNDGINKTITQIRCKRFNFDDGSEHTNYEFIKESDGKNKGT